MSSSPNVCDPADNINLSVPSPPTIVSLFASAEETTVKVSSPTPPVSVSLPAPPIRLKPPVALAKLIIPPSFTAVKFTLDAVPEFVELTVETNSVMSLAFRVAPAAIIIMSLVPKSVTISVPLTTLNVSAPSPPVS